ncbi:DNA topoisomerase domain-containing protein [Ditylenchus destructor]|nr:DNA topoisomerase domain-containing protein [Ditylenchus destructor]
MVVKRFLAVFFPPAEFQTNGKVLIKPGWQAVYGKGNPTDENAAPGTSGAMRFPPVKAGELVRTEDTDVKALVTKPPARYTERRLSAMEGAGKLVDDDELRGGLAEKGRAPRLPRAPPSSKPAGRELMTLLRGPGRGGADQARADRQLGAPAVGDGEGASEARGLHGRDRRDDREGPPRKAKEYDRDTVPGDYATLRTPCPNCGGVVKENYRRYACTGKPGDAEGCGFSIPKIPGGRSFELHEVETFLRDKHIGPLEGFRSKAGWPFTAELALVFDAEIDNWKLEFDFGEDAKKAEENGEPVDFSGKNLAGSLPQVRRQGLRLGSNYVCEHAVGDKVTCDFKSGKIILQQPVEPEQVSKLREKPARRTCGKKLRLQQDARKLNPLPGLRQEGRQGRLRVRAARREAGRQAPGAKRRPRPPPRRSRRKGAAAKS